MRQALDQHERVWMLTATMEKGEVHCPECVKTLKLSDFYRTKTPCGHMRVCKSCHKTRVAKRQAERYTSDPEYRAKMVKKVGARQAERYTSDPEYRAKMIKGAVKRGVVWQAKQYRENYRFALRKRMSVAVRHSLKSGKLGVGWVKLLGYNVADLIKHLEAQFLDGMSWENFGEWHIDHVVPQAAFSFESERDPQFKKCWALENLQPLWASENLSKSDFLPNGKRARAIKDDCCD